MHLILFFQPQLGYMDFGFKEILFGLAAVSMIIWIAVIGLWHTYMFPRFFKEDNSLGGKILDSIPAYAPVSESGSNIDKGQLRPMTSTIGLPNRNKYTRQSIVLADFNPVEDDYGVNRLYTGILFAVGITTFVLLTYGLHSGFDLI